MLIAWQTLNKVAVADGRALHQPVPRRHARASRSATGSGCCCPSDAENYYDLRDLVPPTSRAALDTRADRRSRTTTPSCSRTPRRSRASRRTRASSCTAGQQGRPVQGDRRRRWSTRVLRDLGGPGKQARSSSSTTRRTTATRTSRCRRRRGRRRGRSRSANEQAPASGSAASRPIAKQVGIKPIYDLSATPVLPQGLRLQRGLHLPVGRQRLLADGRDRVGHRQGAAHPGRRRRRPTELVDLPATCGTTSATSLPKRRREGHDVDADWLPPTELEGALRSLYRSYETRVRPLGAASSRRSASRRRCSSSSAPTPSSPSSSTTGSPGSEVEQRRRGRSPTGPATSRCCRNVDDGTPARPAAHDPRRLGAARVRRGA